MARRFQTFAEQSLTRWIVAAWLALFVVPTERARAADAIAGSEFDDRAVVAAVESIRVEDLKRHVGTLASDALQGREAGSVGGHAASAYVMQELRARRVAGAADGTHYLQEFDGGMRNILATVHGRDPRLRDEVVIVCAHFDHVGFGNSKNSRGPIGYIHNGADDNASGTAGLLEVIEAVQALPQPPRRTLLFAFWDGEEKGLLGSKHWLSSPTVPLKQVKLVVNVDMIGRLRPEGVELTGSRVARGLRRIISEVNSSATARVPIDFTWEIRADSDHFPFISAGIPALMMHTGKHDDYHRPSDDADKLNYEGIQRVARLMLLLAVRAAEFDELPPFRPEGRSETKEMQQQVEQRLPTPPTRLGIVWKPELSKQRIVEISEVSPRSPADDAGLRVGDRILKFADHAVADFADFRTLVVTAPNVVTATVQRPGEAGPRELSLKLSGEPTRLGITWRTDEAEPNGVILTQVLHQSPADLAGLRPLDRVLLIGGQAITTSDEFRRQAQSLPGPLPVTFERGGVLQAAQIELISDAIAP